MVGYYVIYANEFIMKWISVYLSNEKGGGRMEISMKEKNTNN